MKKLFLLFIALVALQNMRAQSFEQGAGYFHAGVGILSPYAYSGAKMGIPPIHVSFEKGITENIGVGALVGYTSAKYESSFLSDSYSWNFSYALIGARGAYHFTNFDKADVYLGGMLGYNIAKAKFESTDPDLAQYVTEPKVGGLVYGGFLGARKSVTDNVTLFGEVGYNIAWLSVGVCVNM